MLISWPCSEVAEAPGDQTEIGEHSTKTRLWVTFTGRMLSVAIALEPPAQAASAVEAVAQSCERAIGAGRCRVAEDVPSASVVTWYAVVVVDPESSALSIQFRDRNASGALIETRELTFSERDSNASRWASAGAVIAAFVAARDSAAEPPPPPPPPAEPLPPPAPARSVAWNVDLALFSGTALDDGDYRWGALGRGYVALPQAPAVLGVASLRYSERPGDLSLAWWSASCGLGARAHVTAFSAELTGEVAFERLLLQAEAPATSETDEVVQNRFGGRLSVNLALGFASHLALVGGAEVTAMRPSISISVGDDDVGRVPAVGYGFSAGLRFGYGD
jgi:hypothetical protein